MISKQTLLSPAFWLRTLALASLLLPLSSTFAQTSPAVPPEVVLSPFAVKVDKDYGYQASNSITATGIGTAIIDIPANINVITKDFLIDQSISELRYAVDHVSSVNTDNRSYDRTGQLNVRGLPAPIQVNGYDNSFISMENVDRVEIIKGPSAVFNGNVLPGGLINVIKGEPKFEPSASLETRYGSFAFFQGRVHQTGPIVPDVLAFNVFASYKDTKNRDDDTFDREKYISLGLKWTPSSKLSSLLDFEGENEIYEGAPEELGVSNPAYVAAVMAGQVPYLQTSRTWLNNNPAYGPNTVNVTEILPASGLYYPHPGYNPLGPNAPSTVNAYNIRSETTFLPTSSLSFSLRFNYNVSRTTLMDFNTFRPVAGHLPGQFVVNSQALDTNADNRTFIAKIEGVYKFTVLNVAQNLLIGAQDEINKSYSQLLQGPLIVYNMMTDPPFNAMAQIASSYPNGFPAKPQLATSLTRGYYAADQVSAFSDRLHLLLGVRRTELSNPVGLHQNKATPELGALYRPFKFMGIYYNYSETFLPNYIVDAFNIQVGPSTGKGHDFGTKIDMLDGKLSATAAIYREDYANIPLRNAVVEQQLHIAPIYSLGGLERTAGLEVDLSYVPVKNYQLVASFSNSWEHRTLASSTPQQINVPLWNIPKYSANLWNKYTFTSGALNGFYVGVGGRAASRMHLNPSWDVALYGRSFVVFSALVGYNKKIGKATLSVQCNVENLTDQVFLDGFTQWGNPRSEYVSVRIAY